MTALAKPQVAAPIEGARELSRVYLETLNLVERLHRQLLDVIKDELDRRDEREINSVQALLLFNIGDQELTAGELRSRGHYLGSNVSYNLKKLVEAGYIHHERSEVDRRSVPKRHSFTLCLPQKVMPVSISPALSACCAAKTEKFTRS